MRARLLAVMGVLACLMPLGPAALGHSGGLDQNGGHHCRQRGYESGSCSPVDSYHCHRSYCTEPGAADSATAPRAAAAPARPRDTEPPAPPEIGEIQTAGAQVTVTVTAEQDSRIAVAAGTTVLHRATATGAPQALRFTAPEGRHELEVTATDAAGNQSAPASLLVDVDSRPPAAPRLEVEPAAQGRPDTIVQVSGEPEAAVALRAVHADGTETGAAPDVVVARTGSVDVPLRLRNGTYVLHAALVDAGGNRSAESSMPIEVAIAPPRAPRISVGSDEGASPVVLVVRGDPYTEATVVVTGDQGEQRRTTSLGEDGRGEVRLPLADGAYEATAVLTDFQGQASTEGKLARLLVKASAPAVELLPIEELLDDGRLVLVVRAERDARIAISSADGAIDEEHEATGSLQSIVVRAGSGTHELTVTVTDRYGNTSVLRRTLTVSEPLGAADALLLAGLLGGAGVGGRALWRRRRGSPRRGPRGRARSANPPGALGGGGSDGEAHDGNGEEPGAPEEAGVSGEFEPPYAGDDLDPDLPVR